MKRATKSSPGMVNSSGLASAQQGRTQLSHGLTLPLGGAGCQSGMAWCVRASSSKWGLGGWRGGGIVCARLPRPVSESPKGGRRVGLWFCRSTAASLPPSPAPPAGLASYPFPSFLGSHIRRFYSRERERERESRFSTLCAGESGKEAGSE